MKWRTHRQAKYFNWSLVVIINSRKLDPGLASIHPRQIVRVKLLNRLPLQLHGGGGEAIILVVKVKPSLQKA